MAFQAQESAYPKPQKRGRSWHIWKAANDDIVAMCLCVLAYMCMDGKQRSKGRNRHLGIGLHCDKTCIPL